MRFLLDPMVFSYVIMGMYALNALQFFARRDVGNGCYWVSALAITATVTFLLQAK